MEPQGLLPLLQLPATSPYPAPDQSSPWLPSHFLKIHLNIVLPSTLGSSKKSTDLCVQNSGAFQGALQNCERECWIRHVCLSVRPSTWYNSALTGRILMEFDGIFFEKSVEKIQVSLLSEKNNKTLREDLFLVSHNWTTHSQDSSTRVIGSSQKSRIHMIYSCYQKCLPSVHELSVLSLSLSLSRLVFCCIKVLGSWQTCQLWKSE